MKKDNENKIKKMYERVDTPEYNPSDKVLAKINKNERVPGMNRKVLIAAILCLILLLTGTAAAAGMFEHIFTISRERFEQIDALPTNTPTAIPEIDTSDMMITQENDIGYIFSQYTMQTEFGECRVAYCYDENGMGHSTVGISPITTYDFNEMIEYLKGSNTPLQYPMYIPKGYEFTEGHINFYLDKRIYGMEPRSEWVENDITYLIYDLPEGFEKNILRYYMTFTDKDDNKMRIHLELCGSDWGMEEIDLQDGVTAEYFEIEGFDDAVLIHNSENVYEYFLHIYDSIVPFESAELSSKIFADTTGNEPNGRSYSTTYDAAIFYIGGEGLSKREVIKIAEGMGY